MTKRAEAINAEKSVLGEGPLWLPESGRLVWVDIEGMKIRMWNPKTGEEESVSVGQRIGAVVRATDGRMVCALQNGFHFLDAETGELEPIADPEAHLPGNRFNDGKCDPAGRFWAGTMPIADGAPTGALYRLDGDGSAHKMAEEIGCSNGLGWSLDGSTMYYIDTSTRRIDKFDFDAGSGGISNRRTVAVIPADQGYPDGMTVDAEGKLWVAHWDGHAVSRFDPDTGECLERVELPVSRVTSCCFGGDDLDELYITSASVGLSEEQLRREPLAGSLFVYKPGVKGLPAAEFKVQGT
ncbi:sugar lactone lactonase YvrE [Cohnella sp. SGD-V74]|uniref:SMP-30/gluconolactonase/LRE family protein n=1 Tax=unclassified Cohnella TaxID=2636738 RepID=UPI000D448D84|nr:MULTISPECIES: SMP-30/gluconolactonase/LRE family protein [unclassified Cohnella]PRX62911.1 sugar lactone lactonase YvrE [Cohnella sp. SGD-V74]